MFAGHRQKQGQEQNGRRGLVLGEVPQTQDHGAASQRVEAPVSLAKGCLCSGVSEASAAGVGCPPVVTQRFAASFCRNPNPARIPEVLDLTW